MDTIEHHQIQWANSIAVLGKCFCSSVPLNVFVLCCAVLSVVLCDTLILSLLNSALDGPVVWPVATSVVLGVLGCYVLVSLFSRE